MENPEEARSVNGPETAAERSPFHCGVAVVAGALLFPLTYFFFWDLDPAVGAPILISAGMMFLAAAAGAVVSAEADWSMYSRSSALATATRIGSLAGFVVFLVGGGMAMLATTTYILAVGVEPGATDWVQPSFLGTISVFLSLVPTVALGAVGCALATKAKIPGPEHLDDPPRDILNPSTPQNTGVNRILQWTAITFVICMLSPIALSILAAREVKPEPIAETTPPAPIPAIEEEEQQPEQVSDQPAEPPLPPPFSYTRPTELSSAPSSKWTVVARKTLTDFDSRGPALISPNSRYLAYTPTDRQVSLSIHDFETDTPIHTIRTSSSVREFSWSPDSEKLFCVCETEEFPFWVVEVISGRSTSLPVPFGVWKVEGKPWWWSEHEVAFIEDQEVKSWLDLESLRLRKTEESVYWQTTKRDTGIAPFGPPPELADTARCQLAVVPRVKSYISPHEHQRGQWAFEADPALGVIDKKTGTTKHLISGQFQEPSRFLSAPDSSKVVVVTVNGVTVYYLGVGDGEVGNLTATLPDSEPLKSDPSFAQLLKSSLLGAMVCAPLVNPLNDKVIGPDRRNAKGMVRILGWENSSPALELLEEYGRIQEGDILTDIHTWKVGATILIDAEPLRDWWTPLKQSGDPLRIDDTVTRPKRWAEVSLTPTNTGLEFRGWSSLSRKTSSSPVLSLVTISNEPAKPGKVASDLPAKDAKEDPEKAEKSQPGKAAVPITPERHRAVSAFVKEHHKKITMEDLDGFTRDYASRVDMFDQGPVDRVSIRKAQADYYPKYTFLSEVVEGEPVVTSVPGAYRAVYRMRSTAVKHDQTKSDNLVEVALDLQDRNGILEIIRQRARLIERK